MASVRLDFSPPSVEGITKLYILESPSQSGTFSVIEEVTAVGAYPSYISYYTTTHAASIDDWFAIQWEDASGARGAVSAPMQGNTTTLVQQIVNRVQLRDPLADENITRQEAEAVIEDVFFVTDAYSVDPAAVTSKQRSGITFLTLARVYLSTIVTSISSGTTQSYTAGLVSQNSGSGTQNTVSSGLANIEQLIEWANRDLGINTSLILQLQECAVAGGLVVNEWTFEAITG